MDKKVSEVNVAAEEKVVKLSMEPLTMWKHQPLMITATFPEGAKKRKCSEIPNDKKEGECDSTEKAKKMKVQLSPDILDYKNAKIRPKTDPSLPNPTAVVIPDEIPAIIIRSGRPVLRRLNFEQL